MPALSMQRPCDDGLVNTPLHHLPEREWLRVSEVLALYRIAKPTLYGLINRGLIRSVSLRQRGQARGTRLVSHPSIEAFLNARATGGETEPANRSANG